MRYLTTLLLLCASAFAQQHKISVQKYEIPVYPIARLAKVSAVVQIEVTVDGEGNVTSTLTRSAQSPPENSDGKSAMIWKQLFTKAAVENLNQWRFHCDDCDYGEPYVVLMRYEFFADKSPSKDDFCFTKHLEQGIEAACFNFPGNVTVYADSWVLMSFTDPINRHAGGFSSTQSSGVGDSYPRRLCHISDSRLLAE